MNRLIPGRRHSAPCEETPPPLSRAGGGDLLSCNDSGTLFNREDLVYIHIRELLNLLCGRPLDLDHVDLFALTHAKVQAQITLRHDTGTGVNLIDLGMASGHDPCSGPHG